MYILYPAIDAYYLNYFQFNLLWGAKSIVFFRWGISQEELVKAVNKLNK